MLRHYYIVRQAWLALVRHTRGYNNGTKIQRYKVLDGRNSAPTASRSERRGSQRKKKRTYIAISWRSHTVRGCIIFVPMS